MRDGERIKTLEMELGCGGDHGLALVLFGSVAVSSDASQVGQVEFDQHLGQHPSLPSCFLVLTCPSTTLRLPDHA